MRAGSVGDVGVQVAALEPGRETSYLVDLTPATALQKGDKIVLDFETSGVDLTSAQVSLSAGGTPVATAPASLTTSTVTLQLTAPPPPGQLTVRLDQVANPPSEGSYSVDVSTSRDTEIARANFSVVNDLLTPSPASVAPAQHVTIQFTFTPESSYTGQFGLQVPAGWSPPTSPIPFTSVVQGTKQTFDYVGTSSTDPGTGTFVLGLDNVQRTRGGSSFVPVVQATVVVEDVQFGLKPDPVHAGDDVSVTPTNVPESCPTVSVSVPGAGLGTLEPSGGHVTIPAATRPGPVEVELDCSDKTFLVRNTLMVLAAVPPPTTSTNRAPPPTTSTNRTTSKTPPPVPPPRITSRPATGRGRSTFVVRGAHVPPACTSPSLYLGPLRIGTPRPSAAGAFTAHLRVPARSRAGRTFLTLHCSGAVVARARFLVGRRPPPLVASLVVEPSGGPRGSVFEAVARRVPTSCAPGELYLGPRRVGSADETGGDIDDHPVVVPVRAAPGETTVVLRCAGVQVATAAFVVTGARNHRTAFVLTAPGDGFVRHRRVLADAGLVALVLLLLVALIGFPADWFNDTYVENRERLRAGFWRLLGRPTPARRSPSRVGLVSFLVVAGVLTCAATDYPTFDRAYLWALLGTTLGVTALTFGFQLPAIVSARAVHVRGRLQVLAGSVGVAAVCVAASRALHLDPPYLYGLIAVFVVEREAESAASARDAALGALATLVLSVGAWLLDLRIEDAAAGAAPSPFLLVLEAALVTVFVAGLGSMVFALVPLPFLPGRAILHWNRAVWLALFGAGAYAFALIMLTPRNGYVATVPWDHVVAALVTFALFAAISVAFMAWFRFVRPASGR